MLTFPQLRDCEPAVYARDAQAWQALATALIKRGGELDDQARALAGWTGTAGDAARANLTARRTSLTGAAETIGRIPPVLTGLGSALTGLRTALQAAISTAGQHHLSIAGDGTVVPSGIVNFFEDLIPGHKAMAHALAAQLTSQVQGLLKQATAADGTASGQLAALTAQAGGLAPATTLSSSSAPAVPAPGTAPADVAKWWNGLSPQQRESALFLDGDRLGALDGIPAAVRDRANRAGLTEQTDDLTEQAARLTASGKDADQLAAVKGKLGGLSTVAQRLAEPPSAAHPQAYLLGLSSDGTGRAIVAMGDPDTATNVATYVPGTGAELAKVGGDLNRSDLMAYAATKAGSPSTSVITWLGYDAPPTIPHAVSPSYAEHAETSLRGFQDGLRATHVGAPSRNTVVGHSYGTTVIGYAAKDGTLAADDVAFVASPGVGVPKAGDLHLTGVPAADMHQHVYATTAQHDMIRAADGVFGPNPSDSGFGATDFTSAPGKAGPWYEGGLSGAVHSQYWDPGNPSLTNLGDIIAGKPTS